MQEGGPMPRNPYPDLYTLWQRMDDGVWTHVHTNDEDRVNEAAEGLRRYGRDTGIPRHEVKVLPAGERP